LIELQRSRLDPERAFRVGSMNGREAREADFD
jgi:hypothetical protein